MVKEPSSFAVLAFDSPFPVFLIVICAFAIGAPETAVIFPERELAATWAGVLGDIRITNSAIAALNKKTTLHFIPKRETMDFIQ